MEPFGQFIRVIVKRIWEEGIAIDRETFCTAVELHSDTITRLLLLRCRQMEDAEDCYQSVFLKLLLCQKPFQDQEHVKAWLIRTAINQAADMNRQTWKKHVTLQEEIDRAPWLENSGIEQVELLDLLRGLPEGQREVVYLHYYEGYRVEETAALLHIRPGTVKSRLSRSRETLKSMLEETEYAELE